MKLSIAAAALLLLGASSLFVSSQECGSDGSFAIAGSSTVLPVAMLWAENYQTVCSGTTITVEGGGSSDGAGRVCANEERGTPVEIGDMSRGWTEEEATPVGEVGGVFQCVAGDPTRSVIQVDVAIDGLSVATKTGGAGNLCIESLGGLTLDQLRWIFSSYSKANLTLSGWDEAALSNSDGDDSTHLWSELSPDCPAVEIKIAGPDSESGTYEYFLETVLVDYDNGETFDAARPDGYTNSDDDEVIAAFLEANEDAIGYFGYAYYNEHSDTLSAEPIQNVDGEYVVPDPTTVADGSYNPLARRIFMNLLNDETTLMMTAPFLAFGYSDEGSALVEQTGYVVIPDSDKEEMLARVSAGLGSTAPGVAVDGAPTDAPGAGGDGSPTDAPGGSSGAIRMFSVMLSGSVAMTMTLMLA